jgi:TPR repeat protein
MGRLGIMYLKGKGGLPQDDAQALVWTRKAVELGDPRAMNTLGFLYFNGRGGLSQDEAKAVEWYRKGAEAGSPVAMVNLGVMERVVYLPTRFELSSGLIKRLS